MKMDTLNQGKEDKNKDIIENNNKNNKKRNKNKTNKLLMILNKR